MEWNYKDALEWSQDKNHPMHNAAKVYVETHNENGAKPNVVKWFDFCELKDIHPYTLHKTMPTTEMDEKVLRFRMGEESIYARRVYGKGYFNQKQIGEDGVLYPFPVIRNLGKLSKSYDTDYRKWKDSLPADELKIIVMLAKGMSVVNTADKNRETQMGDIRKEIQQNRFDVSKVQRAVRKLNIEKIKSETLKTAGLQENGKNAVTHIPGSVWGKNKNEAYRIMDALNVFEMESARLIASFMERVPLTEQSVYNNFGYRMNQNTQRVNKKEDRLLIDLNGSVDKVRQSLGL